MGEKPELLNQIGIFARDRIRSTVRSGYSLDGDKKKKLKKLSESYKDMRRGAVKFRTLGRGASRQVIASQEFDEKLNEVDVTYFQPDLSNLTFTGQLMKALTYLIEPRNKLVEIFINDDKRVGKYEKLTNSQVATHVSNNGRPFLGLDKTGVARIKAIVKKSIRDEIIKQRLRKR